VSRVAYLITSYALPDQVLRLSSTLRRGSPSAWIVVHHDDRRCSLDGTELNALGIDRVEPPSTVAWGEISQLEMILRCLRSLLERADFDWLVMLSGQDYPIRPVAEIEQSLAIADVDAFIETRSCERPAFGAAIDEFAGRYHFRWRRMPFQLAPSVVAAANRAGQMVRMRTMPSGTWVGLRALRTPFGSELTCHRGSDWFTLSRASVEAVERFLNRRDDVLRYYRRTLIPTESLVQTILANEGSLRLSGDIRRYLAFDRSRLAGPRVLTIEDLGPILASGSDFARKFDQTVDRTVLDEIDRRVHAG
jgi:hypothetical protein